MNKIKGNLVRPVNLSHLVFMGKQGEFDPTLGGSTEYVLRMRKLDKPLITITQWLRGKYRWQLALDTIEGFQTPGMTTSFKGTKLLTPYFADKTYRHPREFSFFGPQTSYWYASFSNLDYVVASANTIAALPRDCFEIKYPDLEKKSKKNQSSSPINSTDR